MNMTFIPSRSRSKNSSQLKPSTFERLLWRTVFPAQNGMCYHQTISFLQLVELHRALKIDQVTLVLQADAVITGIRFHHSRFSQHIFRGWIKISQFWLIASRIDYDCFGKNKSSERNQNILFGQDQKQKTKKSKYYTESITIDKMRKWNM